MSLLLQVANSPVLLEMSKEYLRDVIASDFLQVCVAHE